MRERRGMSNVPMWPHPSVYWASQLFYPTRKRYESHWPVPVVGVPAAAASRAGPPDNGGSLFIYPSMRTDTTDRLPFIGKSFLIPQMSGSGGFNRRPRLSLRVRATRERPSCFDLESTNAGARGLASVFRDVWLDNCGDRLYFVRPRGFPSIFCDRDYGNVAENQRRPTASIHPLCLWFVLLLQNSFITERYSDGKCIISGMYYIMTEKNT